MSGLGGAGAEDGSGLSGRQALPLRTVLGLIMYGIVMRRSWLREIERLARTDLGRDVAERGAAADHSTVGKFINLHHELLEVARRFFLRSHHLEQSVRGASLVPAARGFPDRPGP